MNRAFVTGGSGMLGSRLVAALCRRNVEVVALDRSGHLAGRLPEGTAVDEVVSGDLLRPESYAPALGGVDTIMHLAAATGGADKETHFRVNVEGTRILLQQARSAGVRRFLFVSSIAVKFHDKTRYYYAQSKELAEEAVRASGLGILIVRPTIIAAPGSGVLASLQRLATLPVIVVPGPGKALVQPVWVDDLVDSIVGLGGGPFAGDTVEVGGPQALPIEELLQEVRRVTRGSRGRVMHLPLGPLLAVVRLAESVRLPGLPVTAGQLASFRFDGVADGAAFPQVRPAEKKTVSQMLELSFAP